MTVFARSPIIFIAVNILRILSVIAIILAFAGQIVVLVQYVPSAGFNVATRLTSC